jgi:secreted protein with Ig-like and vWFA domain
MTPHEPDPSSTYEPRAGQRRGALLLAACSLLAVGIAINIHRHTAIAEDELTLVEEPAMVSQRFVGYMMQPDGALEEEAPELEPAGPEDEAGGQGQRHKGEEGRLGKPSAKHGLYAMRGPRGPIPQMARNFDPELAARNAGILGQMQQESGYFLASPYGAAFSVGNDDEGVRGGAVGPDPTTYPQWVDQVFVKAADDAVSTFSIDVDTGSYTLLRRGFVEHRSLPAPYSVRVEEMINYFDYAYPEPTGEVPVSITTEVGPCPWDDAHRLVHVGLQGKHVAPGKTPPRNLVFLVDVSGSMSEELPLVVSSLTYLTEQLGAQDHIAIVVYAGAAGTVLAPTVGSDKARILGALERLEAGGSTNGGEGIEQAYALAAEHFLEGGINRVVLATDGDFNVGTTSQDALVELIEAKRKSGVFLSVLGFGDGNYQDETMEQLADKGNGNYAYIDGLAEARKVLVEQAGGTLVTIAKDVKLQVDFDPELVSRYRLVGYTNRVLADRDFADDTKDAGEIGAGHTVTALYEIEPAAAADDDDGALMALKLRYKDPDGDKSKLVQVPVTDGGATLAETSDDFRFSAAVAGFGQALQGLPSKASGVESLEALRNLARDARGTDAKCRRAELVRLIEEASELSGHTLSAASIACKPDGEPQPLVYADPLVVQDAPAVAPAVAPANAPGEPFDWQRFVLEVLYLLPPLLALPLFVMALRRPRRRAE